ncbi:hypothetical protein B0T24DRAFT_110771 [Lasiosphaeria ovina]|uniref:Uncharacterized protein n=1 Tax=Lasiosphaeria ovina TaxID=92902 RepID=A0AAE0MYY7_9PEZI|nr:hypothetical protein B0T24DRAFT_110771 [Lasiosphaeria ovina]
MASVATQCTLCTLYALWWQDRVAVWSASLARRRTTYASRTNWQLPGERCAGNMSLHPIPSHPGDGSSLRIQYSVRSIRTPQLMKVWMYWINHRYFSSSPFARSKEEEGSGCGVFITCVSCSREKQSRHMVPGGLFQRSRWYEVRVDTDTKAQTSLSIHARWLVVLGVKMSPIARLRSCAFGDGWKRVRCASLSLDPRSWWRRLHTSCRHGRLLLSPPMASSFSFTVQLSRFQSLLHDKRKENKKRQPGNTEQNPKAPSFAANDMHCFSRCFLP